jgi:hypothetical protein
MIYDMRKILIDLWNEASFLEESRVTGLHNLFIEIGVLNPSLYDETF